MHVMFSSFKASSMVNNAMFCLNRNHRNHKSDFSKTRRYNNDVKTTS